MEEGERGDLEQRHGMTTRRGTERIWLEWPHRVRWNNRQKKEKSVPINVLGRVGKGGQSPNPGIP